MCYLWHSPSSPVSLVFTVSSSGAPSLEDRSASSPLVCRMMTCSSAIRLIQSGSPSILTPPRFCLSSENSYKITTIICCLWMVGCLSSKQIMTVGFFSIRKDIKSTLSSNRDDVWDQFRVCLYTEIGFNFFWSNNVHVDNNNVTIHQQHEQQGQHCGIIWGDFVETLTPGNGQDLRLLFHSATWSILKARGQSKLQGEETLKSLIYLPIKHTDTHT